jgi:ectoine hydroxylase-related dioxygenase (phytanoyl-CoA dioxygenase family)
MYVIPKRCVPRHLVDVDFRQLKNLTHSDLSSFLQGARALPAIAGSLLGWNHQLIHWGSRNHGSEHPRISLSVEFVAKGSETFDDDHPLFENESTLPSFTERLKVIGKCIEAYRRFEPSLLRYQDLARRLTALHS